MTRKQKLELTLVGKENQPRLEPRILLGDPEKSYHAKRRVSDDDIFDDRLIFGDNLLALEALEPEFVGKVKCAFIDPPYNTGSAFEHHDDGLEHSIWLGLMRDRLEIIRRLLSEDGSIWITIDDNEAHYLKVVLDEIFGRNAFIANIVWQKRTSRENRAAIGSAHDHILVCSPQGSPAMERRAIVSAMKVATPIRTMIPMGLGVQSRLAPKVIGQIRCTTLKRPQASLSDRPLGAAGDNQAAKKEIPSLFDDDIFDTPKPEKLLRVIAHIATNPGDLILASFAGSGTTGAVAHEMGRRWIMAELGEQRPHAHHPAPEEGD